MFNNIDLYYWATASSSEIDFIIYNEEGIIPIEVKANSIQLMFATRQVTKYTNICLWCLQNICKVLYDRWRV